MNGIENNELTWKERVVGYEEYWWNEIRKIAEPQEKLVKFRLSLLQIPLCWFREYSGPHSSL